MFVLNFKGYAGVEIRKKIKSTVFLGVCMPIKSDLAKFAHLPGGKLFFILFFLERWGWALVNIPSFSSFLYAL